LSLFEELKRRKVVRVAVVYAATAFAIVQAADVMLPRLGVPDWTLTLIVVLVVLGFPVAVVLGWALELTPEGVRVTAATPTAGARAAAFVARQAHGVRFGVASGGRCRAWCRLVPAARGRIARRVATFCSGRADNR
jgi:hypothetical protein